MQLDKPLKSYYDFSITICLLDICRGTERNPHMIELIILGFLSHNESLTLYDIKKGMERSTEYFLSTSQGAIHPALVKLEHNGYIKADVAPDSSRKKKYYRITDSGKVRFGELMRQDLGPDKYKCTQLLKMFFFQELTKEERIQSIITQITYFQDMKRDLLKIQNGEDRPSDKNQTIFKNCKPAKYENDALEFGLAYTDFVIEWFDHYLKRIGDES